MPNAQHQRFHGFMAGAPYELAIVEFDDQGRCYDRGQMDSVAKRLDALAPEDGASAEDAILIVFVHGWKHDARSDDDNLTAFRVLLKETVEYENGAALPGVKPRPVLGVFVGWRGLSDFGLGDIVADATFWGRQAAGQRVATGSVRELFGRARRKNRRAEPWDEFPPSHLDLPVLDRGSLSRAARRGNRAPALPLPQQLRQARHVDGNTACLASLSRE
jgi:hypothetical protein